MVSIIMFVFSFKSKTPLHLSNNSIHRPRAWQFALLNCEVDNSVEEEAGFQHLLFCHFTGVSLPCRPYRLVSPKHMPDNQLSRPCL